MRYFGVGRRAAAMVGVALVLAACGGGNQQPSAPQQPPSKPTPTPSRPGTSTSSAGAGQQISDGDLDRAEQAAHNALGDGRMLSIEPERLGGKPVWDAVFITPEPALAEVTVDPASDRVSPPHAARSKDDPRRKVALLEATSRTWRDAANAAAGNSPGSVLAKVSLDSRNDNPAAPVWEITVLTRDRTVEYEFDANTLAQVSKDVDQRRRDDFD